VTTEELLNQLEEWADCGGPFCNEGTKIATLMRAAADEIRGLLFIIELNKKTPIQK
jgi:hypothetical protein